MQKGHFNAMQSTLMQWKRHFKCNDKHFNALLWMLMQCNTEPAHWWEQPSLPGLFLLSTKLQVTALHCTCVVCSVQSVHMVQIADAHWCITLVQCTLMQYITLMHIADAMYHTDISHWYSAHWCNASNWCRCNASNGSIGAGETAPLQECINHTKPSNSFPSQG